MKRLLFHDADPNKPLRNSGLRDLDQSWRLTTRSGSTNEVILVRRHALR